MITIAITVDPKDARQILVSIEGPLKNRKGLNAVLAQRMAVELKEHFRTKNAVPNKKGWKKTGFWNQLGRSTAVDKASISEAGADVVVSDYRFRIHLYGGDIKPTGGRKFLAIPLVEDARGLNPASYEQKTKRELFRIGFFRVLFEKRTRGGDSSLVAGATGRRYRDGKATELTLGARQQLRAVYALATKATIKADPDALPDLEKLAIALNQEAADFLEREMLKAAK